MIDLDAPGSRSPRARRPRLARGTLAGLAALALSLFSRSADAAETPRLDALLKAAQLVVRAHVDDVTEYDNGRVAVASLRIDEVLKGTPPKGGVHVIEMRDMPLPPLFETGHDMVAFLTVATRNSYLAQHIPIGDYMGAVKVKPGVLSARSAADAESMAKLIAGMVSGSRAPRDAGTRAPSNRTLGFALIAASHPVLIEDGITGISHIENLSTSLTADEQQTIEATLQRGDVPARLRILLLQTIANLNLKQLVPALRAIQTPELADAAWQALTKLGAAPAREDMQKQLASPDAAMRTAAIQQLLRTDKTGAIPRAAEIAKTDPDTNVRVAATEALGRTGTPEAVPALEGIYAEPTWETRQAVGRALMEIGGRTAAEAFERMAFTAPSDAQRYAVVLLMLSVPRDDALLQRIRTTHPDPELRDLAEHGVEQHHH